MISAVNLSMRYGAQVLFRPISFQLNPGQHYGLVGANGAGKSTLIKIMTGEITPISGDVAVPSQLRIGTLKQNQFMFDDVAIIDVVIMGKEKLWKAFQEKEDLLNHTHFTETECEELAELEKIIDDHNGYSARSEAANLLEGLGILAKVHDEPMRILSGGYKLRVLLAQVLFSSPEILLLDEPTNHLDLHSIRWLEGYLNNFPGTLLISSHDRDFLNGVCNHIIDLDHETVKIYKGNFEDFLETKAEEKVLKDAILEKQGKRRDDMQEFIDRFGAKASKARQAASKAKLVEKLTAEMDSIDLTPSSRMYPKIRFDQVRPAGQIVLKVKELTKSFGEKRVLNGISFEIEKGERVALLGANGIGKSTLLEILTNNHLPNSGEFQWGFATYPSYFPQDHKREVNGKNTLLEWLSQQDPVAPEQKLREILARVLFTGDEVKKQVGVLSGGETARLILAKMMLQKHNVLIFDEPTNHLDMEAIEALLEALDNYEGTVIFVSHNRHFVSHYATRVLELSHEGARDYKCSFAEYLAKRDVDLLTANLKDRKKKEDKTEQKAVFQEQKTDRNSKNQQDKKQAQLEKKIQKLEDDLKKIDEELAKEEFYRKPKAEQAVVLQRKEQLDKELEATLEEWGG
jgi:ATPase subunit of ABC transporter with duplicated ATPase domains